MIKKLFLMMVGLSLVSGCATMNPPFQAHDLSELLTSGKYIRKVDNCIVIVDASGSMAYMYHFQSKLNLAKYTLQNMNDTIPDLKINIGLRTFGKGLWELDSKTELIYGINQYTRADFGNSIKLVPWASGRSPLMSALDASGTDLKNLSGPSAIIIISDGRDMDISTVKTAEAIKNQFGDKLNIHSISVGDDNDGKTIVKQIALAGQGVYEDADKLADPAEMSKYVKAVFLREALDADGDGVYDNLDQCPDTEKGLKVDSRGCPLDSDGDGVYDNQDSCPQTPKGVQVDTNGCPLDTDQDGVLDMQDQCPNSPKGSHVNAQGCGIDTDKDGVYDESDKCPNTPEGAVVNAEGCWYIPTFYFKTGKHDIKTDLFKHLESVVGILLKAKKVKLIIEGHTDSVGRKESNMTLSTKRAKTASDYLIKRGVAPNRIETIGFGPTKPAAKNDTDEGRALNRRVEFKLIEE